MSDNLVVQNADFFPGLVFYDMGSSELQI